MKDKTMLRVLVGLLTASVVLGGAAVAQEKPAPASAPAEIKDERALKLLKAMSDKLAAAKSLSFSVRGLVPAVAPTGQYINLFASSRVVMQRPDKLFVEARGDMFPSDIFYNGKTITVMGLGKKFYVQQPAAGAGFDTFVQSAQPGSDAVAPFFDMLTADPYATLTKDFLSALFVGQSTVGGVKADHLAFTAKGVDWEIWIGAADKLPRLMVVSYRIPERHRTFTVEFSNWKLNAPAPPQTFNATIPPGATKLEFKPEVSAQKR
jgi:hypothetical protein